jgi:hypothetical protein
MSSQGQAALTPLPIGTSITAGTLRAEMEARRAAGNRFNLREALAIVVPLCTRLGELHAQGKRFFIHPSSLRFAKEGGIQVLEDRAHVAPTLPRDRACLAPEERKGAEGDARASVFAVGAILYELLTSGSVGPGMRRPSDLVPDLPPELEVVLGKALVADPRHRPGDLGALAQALHHIAPNASIAPPPADESHLDHDGDFEVDIRLSMIPPNERPGADTAIPKAAPVPKFQTVQSDGPFTVAVAVPTEPVRRSDDPTQRLADMKAALESDPRPRYVVIKDGMDHGPFSAVELLQQIASAAFTGENVLRDSFSNEERFIKDWDEFAPFAEQAKLNRDIVQEKKALDAVVATEKRGTQYKALVGAAAIGLIGAVVAGLWLRDRANKDVTREVQGDVAQSIDVDAGLGAGTKKGPGGTGRVVGAGGHPMVPSGMSCEGARSRYVEDYDKSAPPDLSANAYGNVLNNGKYLQGCAVPASMSLTICAAIQNGRAVGVTVTTNPKDGKVASCVAGAVRGLSFPAHPRLDVTTTSF